MGVGGGLAWALEGFFDDLNNYGLFCVGIDLFLNPAVFVLCFVGGIKIGWSFLKRAFH